MPTEEDIETELERARRDVRKYRIPANGCLLIPFLSAAYAVGAIYFLSNWYGPLSTVDISDAPTIFLGTGLAAILSLPYMFCLWMLNEVLARRLPEWGIAVLAGSVLAVLYLFHHWSKSQMGVA